MLCHSVFCCDLLFYFIFMSKIRSVVYKLHTVIPGMWIPQKKKNKQNKNKLLHKHYNNFQKDLTDKFMFLMNQTTGVLLM